MRSRAFTLIELLVVISIIALLSSVVLASLNAAREKARIGAAKQFSGHVERVAGEQAVGIWDFDDCTGTVAVDRSGFGNSGTLIGGPTWSSTTPFSTGCSIAFDGVDDYVRVSDSSTLKFGSGDLTYSFWINYAGTPNGIMLGKYTFSGNHTGFWIWMQSGGGIIPNLGDGTDAVALGATGLAPIASGWHFVTVTVNRSTQLMTLYEDGRIMGTPTSVATVSPIDTSTTLAIGSDGTLTAGRYFAGLIDSVRVYAKALTASEVGALYAEAAAEARLADRI